MKLCVRSAINSGFVKQIRPIFQMEQSAAVGTPLIHQCYTRTANNAALVLIGEKRYK